MANVKANGLSFHVQRLGRGEETVVFVHGMVMDNLSSFYYTLANPVARNAEVILYDLRGHGRSERPPTGYRVVDSVADLAALLDAMGVRRPVHLVGNSYGGAVCLGLAIAQPERVAGMVLIEAHFAVEGWGTQMAGSLELAGYKLGEDEVKLWLEREGGRKLNRMARNADALIDETSLVGDLRDSAPFPEKDLRGIRCPVLAVYGELSDVIDRARDLERLLPRCELEILENCSHSVLMERTPELRRFLTDWLSRRLALPRA